MSNKTYQVFGKSLSYCSEPELIVKGLTYQEANSRALSLLTDFISRFGCQFEVTAGNGVFEATKKIEGSSMTWGYRYNIEPEPAPEPEEKRFSLSDIRKAFEELSQIIQIEGGNPEKSIYCVSSIESDLLRVLRGGVRVQSGEVVFS